MAFNATILSISHTAIRNYHETSSPFLRFRRRISRELLEARVAQHEVISIV